MTDIQNLSRVLLISCRNDLITQFQKNFGGDFLLKEPKTITEIELKLSVLIVIDVTDLNDRCLFVIKAAWHLISCKTVFIIPSDFLGENRLSQLNVPSCNKLPFPCPSFFFQTLTDRLPSLLPKLLFSSDLQSINLHPEEKALLDVYLGSSKVVNNLKCKLAKVAKSDGPILLTGETGTGKTMVSEILHKLSSRREKPFIPYVSSSFDEYLADSRLFGVEIGSFTDAKNGPGLFEIAEGGTLFLDEIGLIPIIVQGKLLMVLDSGTYYKVGNGGPKKCNVRLISATNEKLEDKIKTNEFRSDLYYRIFENSVELPPLRNHKEDIRILAESFAKKRGKYFSSDAFEKMMEYDWPGNVRQLERFIYNTCVMCETELITADSIRIK